MDFSDFLKSHYFNVPDNISILEWKNGKIISTINFPIEKNQLDDNENINLLNNKEIEII